MTNALPALGSKRRTIKSGRRPLDGNKIAAKLELILPAGGPARRGFASVTPSTTGSKILTRLTGREIERLMAAARKSSRYGHRDVKASGNLIVRRPRSA